jgi:hypothetical protein
MLNQLKVLLSSTMMHSVVKIILAIEVAFCKPEQSLSQDQLHLPHTCSKSILSSVITDLKFLLLNFSIITAFIPAFSAIRLNGAKIAREIIIAQ